MSDRRYITNIAEPMQKAPDPHSQLAESLQRIIRGCPPTNPWTDTFRNKPMGLWTGPTSLAYLFLWLSRTHPSLIIDDKSPTEWCNAYLDCGQADLIDAKGLNGWGIKNEYLASYTVKACVTQDMKHVDKVREAIMSEDFECPLADNEHLSGRAGTLALLRILSHWVPAAATSLKPCMKALIEVMLPQRPWRHQGHDYIGSSHGVMGIITQIVLCDSSYAEAVEPQLVELLDMQASDGHWFITGDPELGSPDLVHVCHGSPGMVLSLVKLRPLYPHLQSRIDLAIEKGRNEIWEKGLLVKEPNLCHGITGNMLALGDWDQRRHFMAHTTREKIDQGLQDGTFVAGDDGFGLLWGEAGRAWGWMMMDLETDLGYPSYTDV